jgi:putative mRNA 3-end processing factor
VVFAYSLGKAQRVLAGMLGREQGAIYTHGAVERLTQEYRASGVKLPDTTYAAAAARSDWAGSLILAPPSASGSTWLRKFGPASTAFASGWMSIRGTRRRRGVDRGFVLSDHVDWPALLAAVEATGAERVWVTHGYREQVARWFGEHGLDARAIESRWTASPKGRVRAMMNPPDEEGSAGDGGGSGEGGEGGQAQQSPEMRAPPAPVEARLSPAR